MAKKPVDVEDVMQWAAAELARKRPNTTGKVYRFDVAKTDREIMGRWNWPMGYSKISPMFSGAYPTAGNARGDPPDDDALIVEDAVTRLRMAAIGFASDVVDSLTFGLGFDIDAVAALRKKARGIDSLVLVHGRQCDRPRLCGEAPNPSPRKAKNGKPGVWRLENLAMPTFDDHAEISHQHEVAMTALKRRDQYPVGRYCVLEWDPAPQEIVDERAEYWAWRAGLVWLAEALAGRLEKRAVLPPRAAERPWMGESDAAPLRDLFGPGADRIYGADEAATLNAERGVARRRPVCGGAVYAWDAGRDEPAAKQK